MYLNDDYKVTSKLNLTLGLRFDYQGPWTERFDRMSSFDPSIPNPGAGGRPGALNSPAPARQDRSRTFDNIPFDAIGPRFGFAYKASDKQVIRGGYGIYYAGVTFGQGSRPTIGFDSNPTALNLTNGREPAFNLDQGFPASAIRYPPFIDPTFANGTAPVGYPADGLMLPQLSELVIDLPAPIGESILIDAAYIGNKGTRLPHNPQFLGPGYNMNDPKVLALRNSGASVEHQFAFGAGGGNNASVSWLYRHRRSGTPAFSAVSGDRVP